MLSLKTRAVEPAYAIRELDATAHLPPQHDQLMPERPRSLPQVGSST